MTKVAKSLMFFLISVVVVAGIALGAVFLLNKRPDVPVGPQYTEEEKNFISSVEGGMKTLKTAEPVALTSTTNFVLFEIYDVVGDYVVAKDKENGNPSAMAVYKRNGTTLTKIVGKTGAEYCRVFDVYGDYALVSNNLDSFAGVFLINLNSKEKIGNFTFDNYVNAESVSIAGLTYELTYQFSGNYFIEIYTNYSDNYKPCSYKFNLVNLESGTFYDFVSTGSEHLLRADEVILDYSVEFGFFIIKTTKKSIVYELGDVLTDKYYQVNNIVTAADNIYDYKVGTTYYYSSDEFNLHAISNNKILVNHLVAAGAEDANIIINLEKPIVGSSTNTGYKYLSQDVVVYNTKTEQTSDSIIYQNEYLEFYESNLDGFVLLVGTKVFAEDDYKIQINTQGGLVVSAKTARYLDVSSLKNVIEYDYKAYGPVLAYINDKLICLKDSGYSSYIISPIDFNGNKLAFGNFDLDHYVVYTNGFGENQFVFGGTKCGVADYNGNVITTISTAEWISNVFNSRLIYKSGLNNKYYLADLSLADASYTEISNMITVVNGVGETHTNNIEGYKLFGPVGYTGGTASYYEFALERGMQYYFTYNYTNPTYQTGKYYILNDIGGGQTPTSFANISNYFFVNQENGFDIIYESEGTIYLLSSQYSKAAKQETVAQASLKLETTVSNGNIKANNLSVKTDTSSYSLNTSAQQMATTEPNFNVAPEEIDDPDHDGYKYYLYNIDNFFECNEAFDIVDYAKYLPTESLYYYTFNMQGNGLDLKFGSLTDIEKSLKTFLDTVAKRGCNVFENCYPICEIRGVSTYSDVPVNFNQPAFSYSIKLSGQLHDDLNLGACVYFKVEIALNVLESVDNQTQSYNFCFASGDLTTIVLDYTISSENVTSTAWYELSNYNIGVSSLNGTLNFIHASGSMGDYRLTAGILGLYYDSTDGYYLAEGDDMPYKVLLRSLPSLWAQGSMVTLSPIGYGEMTIGRGRINPYDTTARPLFSKAVLSSEDTGTGAVPWYLYGFNNKEGVENKDLPFNSTNEEYKSEDGTVLENGYVLTAKNGIYIFERDAVGTYNQVLKRQYTNSKNAKYKISDLTTTWTWEIVFCDAFSFLTFWDDCGTADTRDDYDMVEFALNSDNSGYDSKTGRSGAVFYEGDISAEGSRNKLSKEELTKIFPAVYDEAKDRYFHYYTVFYNASGACYGIQNGAKIYEHLPFYIKKPGYEAVSYSLNLTGSDLYRPYIEEYVYSGTNDVYTSMFKVYNVADENYVSGFAYLDSIYKLDNNKIVANQSISNVDVNSLYAIIKVVDEHDFNIINEYRVKVDASNFSSIPINQIFMGTLGRNYYSSGNKITLDGTDNGNGTFTLNVLDEYGKATGETITISKKNLDYLFAFNSSSITPLKAIWQEQKFSVVLYAQQEKFNGQELLGDTNDWYYYNKDTGEYVATGFASSASENVSDFRLPTITPALINDGKLSNVLALSTKLDAENKYIFTVKTALTNWPTPTKLGYKFVGWRPMKYDAKTEKLVAVAGTYDNGLGAKIERNDYDIIYVGEDAEGNKLYGFTYKGTTFTSFKNYPVAIDFENPNSELYFKAIFEEIEYEIVFKYINDGSGTYLPADAVLSDNQEDWVNTEGFKTSELRDRYNNKEGRQYYITSITIKNFAEKSLPRMIYSDWIINNLLFTVTNAKSSSDGSFEINYISDANGVSKNMAGDRGENDDFVAASSFNLASFLAKINTIVKNYKYAGDTRSYYDDSINTYVNQETGEDNYYATSGYNLTRLVLDVTAKPLSKYIEVLNDSTTIEDNNVVQQGEIQGSVKLIKGENTTTGVVNSTKSGDTSTPYEAPFENSVVIMAEATPRIDWLITTLDVVLFTGRNVQELGGVNKDEVLVIPYTIIWKNNRYYDIIQGAPVFKDASLENIVSYSDLVDPRDNPSGKSELQIKLEEMASRIGCELSKLNGVYTFKNLVGIAASDIEALTNIPCISIKKLANYAQTNNVYNNVSNFVTQNNEISGHYAYYHSVWARSVQLRFKTTQTTYDVIIKAVESGSIGDSVTESKVLEANGVINSGNNSQINVGAIVYGKTYGGEERGAEDDIIDFSSIKYGNTNSTLNPQFGMFNYNTRTTGLSVVAIPANKENLQTFSIASGGTFSASINNIETARYSHFASRIILADLSLKYDKDAAKFSVQGLKNLVYVDFDMILTFNLDGTLTVSLNNVEFGTTEAGMPKIDTAYQGREASNIAGGSFGKIVFGLYNSSVIINIKRIENSNDELVLIDVELELPKAAADGYDYSRDKMLVCEFKEYKHSYATVIEKKDGGDVASYILSKNIENYKGGYNDKIGVNSETKEITISENVVKATDTITYAVEAPAGYYLKTLKIITPAGNTDVVLSGYPQLKADGSGFEFYSLLGYFDVGGIENSMLSKGGYDGNANSYKYKNTFLSILARQNQPNNYDVIAFDATTKAIHADHPLVFNIVMNGFYGGVIIETEFESFSAIKINNAMVNIDVSGNVASNLDKLDYALNVKGSVDGETVNLAEQTIPVLSTSPTALLSGNYYIAQINNGYEFVIIGRGALTIEVYITFDYLSYEDIGAVNSANNADNPIAISDFFGSLNLTHPYKKSNILTQVNDNVKDVVTIKIERYYYNFTLLVELGYYSGEGDKELFSSYAGVYKYSENSTQYLSLLAKRLNLSAYYFGENSNPVVVPSQAGISKFYAEDYEHKRVAVTENNGYIYESTISKTFAYYQLSVLKGTAVNLPFGVLSAGYELEPEIYLSTSVSDVQAKAANRTNKASDLINGSNINLQAIAKNEGDDLVVLLRFIAKPYNIKYLPYEDGARPATFGTDDSGNPEKVAIVGNSFYDASNNIVGITKQTWFDSKILSGVNYINPNTVTITGHTSNMWVRSKQIDGETETWTALNTEYKPGQEFTIDVLQFDNEGNISAYNAKKVLVNYSNIINEDFITDLSQDTFTVYMDWSIVKIYVKVSLNDVRDGKGSTAAEYKTQSDNPIKIDQEVPYIFNQLYSAKIEFDGFQRDGYYFMGLSTEKGAYVEGESLITETSKVVLSNAEIAAGKGTAGSPLELYAKWKPWKYKVRYSTPGIALVLNGDLSNNGTVTEVKSLNAGSVERFTSQIYQTEYEANCNSGHYYIETYREFDESIEYPSIACAGYDLIGWFIDLGHQSSAQDGVVRVNLNVGSEHYYAMVSSSQKTNLIWYFLSETGDNRQENGVDYSRIVKIETRWRLQGVKIRLVTKYVPEGVDYSGADEKVKRNGNALDTTEKERLISLAKKEGNSLLTYLLKDANNGNNGVTNNFYTHEATVFNKQGNQQTVYYDCVIDYYAPVGSGEITSYDANGNQTTLRAPTAVGYIFKGYYYYTTGGFESTGPRITTDAKIGGPTSNFDLFQEDNTVPLVFYACWQIKTYNVSLSIPQSLKYLLSSESAWYTGDGSYVAVSVLDFVAVYSSERLESGNRVEKTQTVYDNNGVLNFSVNFYDTFDIFITMPEGHYLSEINGQSCTWNKKGGYFTSFIALNSNTNSGSIGEALGTNDRIMFAEGLLDGTELKSATYTPQYATGAKNKNYGKLDVKMSAEHVVASYNLNLEFALQDFQVTVVQIIFDKDGNRTSKTITLTPENGVVDYWDKFDTDSVSAGPEYQRGEFFTTSDLNEKATNLLAHIVRNVEVYQKIVESDPSKIEVLFYGWSPSGYQQIPTGFEYVYAAEQNDTLYVNGDGYTWTTSIVGNTIVRFPVLTSFYWPEMVGKTTGIRFAYWVRFGADVEVTINERQVLTPQKVTTLYRSNGATDAATCDIFCCANDPNSFTATFQAGDRYYAVFECIDQEFSIAEVDYASQADDNPKKIVANNENQSIVKILQNPLISEESYVASGEVAYSNYLGISLTESDIDINNDDVPVLEIYELNPINSNTQINDIYELYYGFATSDLNNAVLSVKPVNAEDDVGSAAMVNTKDLYFYIGQSDLTRLQGLYVARVKVVSSSGYSYYSKNVFVFEVVMNTKETRIDVSGSTIDMHTVENGSTVYNYGGNYYSSAPTIIIKATDALGEHTINVSFGSTNSTTTYPIKDTPIECYWFTYTVTVSRQDNVEERQNVVINIITVSVSIETN